MPAVKYGLQLGSLNPSAWVAVTEEADRLGFESVWMPEHLVLPVDLGGSPHAGREHPPIPADVPVFDAMVHLAFLAARTERIRFATHVFNIGLRHPFVTARAAATLDVLSGGRFDFGIGASWLEGEWDAVGLDFATRGARVDEAIGVCRRLWSEPVVEHHGRFFDFGPVMFEPKPTQQPGPPIHVGGDGAAAFRRVATVGDGWVPMNHTLDRMAGSLARIAELRADAGRDPGFEVTMSGVVDDDAAIERYAAAGVTRVLVRPWQRTSGALDAISDFSERFIDP